MTCCFLIVFDFQKCKKSDLHLCKRYKSKPKTQKLVDFICIICYDVKNKDSNYKQ